MDEHDLGQRFAAGGEAELEQVINLYGERLLRYAAALICDYHEAENTVQEVFLSAYQNRCTFDGQNLSAWLHKITYNRSMNQVKKRKLFYFRVPPEMAEPTPEAPGFSEHTIQALSRLKPEERALVYGRVMEEQSYEELSQLLGRSPAALRKKYERAKKRLAAFLNPAYYGKEPNHERI